MSNRILAGLGLAFLFSCGGGKSGPVISSFTATPNTVTIGSQTTLAWTETGATTLTITPDLGTVSGTSATATPGTTTTYTLTATSSSGAMATSTAMVTVLHPAIIKSFTASPAQVAPGASVTLSWTVTDPTSVSIDDGTGPKAQPAGATSVTVKPTAALTAFQLIATGVAGTNPPNPVSAVVRVSAAPVVTFTADHYTILQGDPVTLSWKGNARSYVLDDQSGTPKVLGPLLSYTARPSQPTIYSLTATNGAASVTKMLPVVMVTKRAGTKLVYTDPIPGAEVVALRKSTLVASTAKTLVLDLVTIQDIPAASALALDLPLDSSKVVLATAAGNAGPGFAVKTSALDPGANPVAAKAVISTAGPLKDTLVLGIAQKPAGSGSGSVSGSVDKPLAAGTVLASITFNLVTSGGQGPVFDGTGIDFGKNIVFDGRDYRALLRSGTTTQPGAKSAFAIGTLVVQ